MNRLLPARMLPRRRGRQEKSGPGRHDSQADIRAYVALAGSLRSRGDRPRPPREGCAPRVLGATEGGARSPPEIRIGGGAVIVVANVAASDRPLMERPCG